ncbi:MAG: IS256 family transposase [Planctomycetota bacterium]|jgi:putative transposase
MSDQFVVNVSIPEIAAKPATDFWVAVEASLIALLCRLLPRVLEAELDAFIGAAWHERSSERKTTRAGYRTRRFTVFGRDVDLRIPRARMAGFRSEFLPFRKRRHKDFDQWVLSLYMAGTSMRETTAALYEMFGTSVSPTTVSHIVRTIDAERRTFQSRPLSDAYSYLVFDAMHLACLPAPASALKGVKTGTGAVPVAVLLVRGIREDGTREVVDFRLATGEAEAAWEPFLADLFARGLEGANTQLFVHDGADGLANALHTVYGPVAHQRCVFHKLGNVWDATDHKARHKTIRKEAAAVYDVDTPEEAWKRLADWSDRWSTREPRAVANFCADFEDTLGFLAVPKAHRRWVSTSNPAERYIRELRRRLRPMGVLQGLHSANVLVYVAVKKVSAERRDAIPYSLWTTQERYGLKRKTPSKRKPPRPDMHALHKELYGALRCQ